MSAPQSHTDPGAPEPAVAFRALVQSRGGGAHVGRCIRVNASLLSHLAAGRRWRAIDRLWPQIVALPIAHRDDVRRRSGPRGLVWMPEMDAALVSLRARRTTIVDCADRIGVARICVSRRMVVLGLPRSLEMAVCK